MDILESLVKPFLKQEKKIETTAQTSTDNVELQLGSYDTELPNAKSKFYQRGKSKKESLQEKSDNLISQYRTISSAPEVSSAIDEIVNEVLDITDKGVSAPSITFKDNTNISDSVQKVISENFNELLNTINFEKFGDETFKKWYIDGKLISEVVYDKKNIKSGIQKVLLLSPIGFRKRKDEKTGKIYYMYDTNTQHYTNNKNKDYYDLEQIVVTRSGLTHDGMDIGYLYYAIKTANNMNMIEDSFVIYRVLRAIETRIWNVNIGKMPKSKAENYLNTVINQIKNDLSYNSSTGEFDGHTDMKSLINDYVFPSRNGNESTSVDTIGGSTSFIDSTDDHDMFLKKLYIALKIPVSRLDTDGSTLDFAADDILRGEMKFNKFTNKLRRTFGQWLLELLRLNLIAQGKLKQSEWDEFQNDIMLYWNNSNTIIHNGKMDVMVKQSEVLSDLKQNEIIGKVISYETALMKTFSMTPEMFEEERKKIEKEKKDKKYSELYQVEED